MDKFLEAFNKKDNVGMYSIISDHSSTYKSQCDEEHAAVRNGTADFFKGFVSSVKDVTKLEFGMSPVWTQTAKERHIQNQNDIKSPDEK